jgi:hypothetical protein
VVARRSHHALSFSAQKNFKKRTGFDCVLFYLKRDKRYLLVVICFIYATVVHFRLRSSFEVAHLAADLQIRRFVESVYLY